MAEVVAGGAAHWDRVHRRRDPTETSWYEPDPASSLQVLGELGVDPGEAVIDVGAGASGIAAALLDRGFCDVTALDISAAALQAARGQLGARAEQVRWIEADLLAWTPPRQFQVWHDRAVFHFLTEQRQRHRYRTLLADAVAPGAALVMATFAADGPVQCSGLPVQRWDATALAAELGPGWDVRVSRRVEHHTPAGVVQPFLYVGARHVGVPRQ
ncbi:class I SAM-dependent methyltransferase [Pseudonocardia sp. CA-107938]|uniref:class I SAM-dependent methyltransferase n=1 Tax=Pseudonocardia sp. CA-107938 TaxID=3240021 RepID=UPI003D931009